MSLRFIAVVLGRAQIRAARYTAEGVREARVVIHTAAQDGLEAVVRRLRSAVRQVWPFQGSVTAIGLAAPGSVDFKHGVVRFAPSLPHWQDVSLRDLLVEAFGVPVFVASAPGVAALAEHRFGAGQGVADLVYVTVEESVSGGVIARHRLFVGGDGLGGELGRMALWVEGADPLTGSVASLSSLASGAAIERRARERLAAGEASRLDAAEDERERLTARQVCEAALDGDALAQAALSEAGASLGLGVVNLLYLLNPSMVVFDGLPRRAWEVFQPVLDRTIAAHVPEVYRTSVRLVPAQLGDDRELWGALALCLMELDL